MSQYAREQMIHNLSAKMAKTSCDNSVCEIIQTEIKPKQEPTLTYDEYIDYCKQYAVMPNSDSGKTIVEKSPYTEIIRPIHVGQAMETYSHADCKTVESVFEMEA